MVILLNMRILNIISKHLLKENNYNNQTIKIRYGCIMHNNMCIIHKKITSFFSPCRIFSFLVMLFLWMCVHRRVVVEIRHVWLKHEIYQYNCF